jgi:hypothetical protein
MILCRFRIHKFTERDEHGRITCQRCGKRAPIVFATIEDPALAGRQLRRPKTRRQAR